MKVVLSIHGLAGGGAERVACLLARGLRESNDDVTVVTTSDVSGDAYALPEGVHRVVLGPFTPGGPFRGARNAVRRVVRLREAILESDPDVVVSFMGVTNVRTLWAVRGTGIPVVVSEHTDPRAHPGPFPWPWLARASYPRAARLVSVGRGVDRGFDWLDPDRRRVIHNPLPPGLPGPDRGSDRRIVGDDDRRRLLSVGRLESVKGHDRLIRAFADLTDAHPGWVLRILGEGSKRGALEALVSDLGVQDRVELPGWVPDPFAELRTADLFVLASRAEGFGNAIAEAMACGLPVVATDCPSGPREVVEHGRTGLLVPGDDLRALVGSMDRLMSDEGLRSDMGERGRISARRFEFGLVIGQWRELLSEAVQGRRQGDGI